MFKLWVKEIGENNNIIKHKTFSFKQDFDSKYLFAYMQVICGDLKTETPVILKNHIYQMETFNRVAFLKNDFMDEVSFEKLFVEVIYS